MSAWDWIILSGIPSSHPGGTGQLMRHLEREVLGSGQYDGTIMYSPDGETLTNDQLDLLIQAPKIVLFHPQMLGTEQTMLLLAERRARAFKTHIYLLDSFFFCRRSYNHIDSETEPCLRCIGLENRDAGDDMGCKPWPKVEDPAVQFIQTLHEHVSTNSVRFYTQTETQGALARQHFGKQAKVDVIGLWCDDWDEHFTTFFDYDMHDGTPGNFDIVYHGSRDMAKGLGWILSVASQTPDLSYLVPLDRGPANFSGPSNVTIQPMRWNEGLSKAIKGASITVVPSLWSAPIEGALVKSIVTARATAVVENATAFANEIPESVCLFLPSSPVEAAAGISDAITRKWAPDTEARQKWAHEFQRNGSNFLAKLIP